MDPKVNINAPSLSSSFEDQERQLAEYERKLVIFGRDVGSIPCFRNSFLYGLLSGFGGGIAHFAFTSKIVNATRFGVYSFAGVTFCYWVHCRYHYAMARFHHKQIKHAIAMHVEFEGTEKGIDPALFNQQENQNSSQRS